MIYKFNDAELQEIENYKALLNEHKEAIYAIPKFYAYNKQQFMEEFPKFVKENNFPDDIELVEFMNGVFTTQENVDKLYSVGQEYSDKEREILLTNDIVLFDRFLYEMWNHEYDFNCNADEEVCEAVGFAMEEVQANERLFKQFFKARKEYYREYNGELDYTDYPNIDDDVLDNIKDVYGGSDIWEYTDALDEINDNQSYSNMVNKITEPSFYADFNPNEILDMLEHDSLRFWYGSYWDIGQEYVIEICCADIPDSIEGFIDYDGIGERFIEDYGTYYECDEGYLVVD